MDQEARKQLLLTRIALERAQWTRELGELQRVARPQRLLSAALRATLAPSWFGGLFGRAAGPGGAAGGAGGFSGLVHRLLQAGLGVRRHPVVWPMLAGAWPWVRHRGGFGRLLRWLPVGAGLAAVVWVVLVKRRATAPPLPPGKN